MEKKYLEIIQCSLNGKAVVSQLPPELFDDEEFALDLFDLKYQRIKLFKYFTLRIRSNRKVAIKAVLADHENVRELPDEVRNDRNFYLDLFNSPEYLSKSKTDVINVLLFVDKTIRDDEEVILASKRISKYMSDRLINNKKLVLKLLETGFFASDYLVLRERNSKLANDRDVVLAAVKREGWVYKNLPDEFKEDVEIAATAYLSSDSAKKNIPYSMSNSPEFKKKVAELRKKKTSDTPTLSFKFTKEDEDSFLIDIKFGKETVLVKQPIMVKPRYILSIDDWYQPSKNRPFSRVLVANYKKEMKNIYNCFSQEHKEQIKEETFYKEFIKKIHAKEAREDYKAIRFAFRKEDQVTKLFTFYNPQEKAHVYSMMGVYMPLLKAWYVEDVNEFLIKQGLMSEEQAKLLPSNSMRATDEASYYELEEMNYIVLINEVDADRVKDDTVSFINEMVNNVLNESDIKEYPFDLNDYTCNGYDKYGNSFDKPFVVAFNEAK